MGDFNAVGFPAERIGCNTPEPESMDNFNNCINSLDMVDCNGKGSFFTWSNKREDNLIYSRIDRVLANDDWLKCFPMTDTEFLLPSISDHILISMVIKEAFNFVPKPFHFHSFWMKHPDFGRIVGMVM